MDNQLRRFLCRGAITAVFALIAFSVWAFLLPCHLRHYEQIQYFPYSWDHFCDALSFPGGLASYLSEFCIQFFGITILGALITAVLLALVQCQASRLIMRLNPDANRVFVVLSLIPAICALAFIGKSGNKLSAVIALLLVTEAWLQLSRLFLNGKTGIVVNLLAVPLLYWLCGSFVYVYVALTLVEMLRELRHTLSVPVLLSLAFSLVAVWLLAPRIFLQYPSKWLFWGLGFTDQPGSYPSTFFVLMASMPFLALLSLLLPSKPASCKASMAVMSILLVAEVFVAWQYVKSQLSMTLESIYAYDCAALDGDWDKIISMADKQSPMTPSEVTCLNLALVMTGRSGDSLFDYFQSGVSGLFPNYEKSYMLMLPASEALWRAGLLNMTMHYAFEAYQSFPDGQESARQLKRLAEVNLVNGKTEVADKYLSSLSKTLFYGKWARKWLKRPDLSENPLYEELAAKRDTTDVLLNDSFDYTKQDMLRSLVKKSGKEDCSYHYLLAYDLLSKDMESFKSDFELVQTSGVAPVIYQQALLMDWLTGRNESVLQSPHVSQSMKDFAFEFRKALMARRTQAYMKQHFGKTLWYYYASPSK